MSAVYVPPVICRIAVLNEFRCNFAYVEFKKFGEVRLYAAFWTAWPHRGYDVKEDRICVFLNYEQLVKTTSKDEARNEVERLVAECPDGMSGFLFEEKYKLLKAIGFDS
jgi:hypothetical protein